MKKLIILGTFLIFSNIIIAQNENEVGLVSKFGAAGGIIPMWIVPNFDAINVQLADMGLADFSTNGMFSFGGGGYAYIMFVDNIRIGGLGFGGTTRRDAIYNGIRNEVVYTIGAGAFTVEYTFPFIERIAVSLGAMIGGGTVSIEVFRNQGDIHWINLWNEISDPAQKSSNISRKMLNNFFTLSPTLNVDIPLNRFIALRVGGGYLFTFDTDWEVENAQTLHGVPSNLNDGSFFLQTGIFIGFFAF